MGFFQQINLVEIHTVSVQSGNPNKAYVSMAGWSIRPEDLVCHGFIRETYFYAGVNEFEIFFLIPIAFLVALSLQFISKNATIAKHGLGIIFADLEYM